jgi:hypothetical protein
MARMSRISFGAPPELLKLDRYERRASAVPRYAHQLHGHVSHAVSKGKSVSEELHQSTARFDNRADCTAQRAMRDRAVYDLAKVEVK